MWIVSEPYKIRIPRRVNDRIQSWELSDGIRKAMRSRLLNDLARDPVANLVRVIGFQGETFNLFEFELREGTATYIFQFHFVYAQDENYLYMLECDCRRFPDDDDIDDSNTPVM